MLYFRNVSCDFSLYAFFFLFGYIACNVYAAALRAK